MPGTTELPRGTPAVPPAAAQSSDGAGLGPVRRGLHLHARPQVTRPSSRSPSRWRLRGRGGGGGGGCGSWCWRRTWLHGLRRWPFALKGWRGSQPASTTGRRWPAPSPREPPAPSSLSSPYPRRRRAATPVPVEWGVGRSTTAPWFYPQGAPKGVSRPPRSAAAAQCTSAPSHSQRRRLQHRKARRGCCLPGHSRGGRTAAQVCWRLPRARLSL
jgi:hypothetical protein